MVLLTSSHTKTITLYFSLGPLLTRRHRLLCIVIPTAATDDPSLHSCAMRHKTLREPHFLPVSSNDHRMTTVQRKNIKSSS